MFWKICFFINFALLSFTIAVLLLVTLVFPESSEVSISYNFNEVITFISSIFGLWAMYGLAYGKNILYSEFWLVCFLAVILNDVVYPHFLFLKEFEIVGGLSTITQLIPLILSYVAYILWSLLFAIALYKYARRQSRIREKSIT